MLVALVLLAIFLATSIGVIANEKGTEVAGTITADNYTSERNTIYEIEVQNRFKSDIKNFVKDLFGVTNDRTLLWALAGFFGVDTSSEGNGLFDETYQITSKGQSIVNHNRASFLLDCFRRAGISAEKALSFSNYLSNLVNPEEVFDFDNIENKEDFKGIVGVILFFYDEGEPLINDEGEPVTNDEGEVIKQLVFNPLKLLNYDVYAVAFQEIVDNTMLTVDELAKILYEVIYAGNDDKSDVISRDDFVTIFRISSSLVAMINDFKDNGGTLPQARLLGELAYQSGSELNEILEINGIDYLLNAFGFSSPLPSLVNDPRYSDRINDANILGSLARLEEIRNLIMANKELTKFCIFTATESLLKIENTTFEGIARVKTPGSINPEYHKYMSMISFSRSLHFGLQKGYELTEIKTSDGLANKLAEIMTISKAIDMPFNDDAEQTAFKLSLSSQITDYIAAVDGVYEKFSYIKNATEVTALTENELMELAGYYDVLTDYTGPVLDVYENLLSTVFVNSILNMYLQVQDVFYNKEPSTNGTN
ncbi:MAG TPA: hypothetical protein PKX91_02940 [Clostridia bacterium]|jgi:hypothetical protein|nr:hypothetical protein [Clostridia bacterium]